MADMLTDMAVALRFAEAIAAEIREGLIDDLENDALRNGGLHIDEQGFEVDDKDAAWATITYDGSSVLAQRPSGVGAIAFPHQK